MEPSSNQNSEKNDNDALPRTSQEVTETVTEKNNPLESNESQERNKPVNEVEATENNMVSGSEPSPTDGAETNALVSEQVLNTRTRSSIRKLMNITRKFALTFSYQARERPRQPFMDQRNQRQNPPPAYYPTQNQRRQPLREQAPREQPIREQPIRGQPIRGQPIREQPIREQPIREQPIKEQPIREQPIKEQPIREQPLRDEPVGEEPQREQVRRPLTQQPAGPAELHLEIANLCPWGPYFSVGRGFQWATYPPRISDRVPGSLALLVDTEAIFIMQQLNFIELLTSIPESNFYLVLNKHGECLYYVYETFGCLEHCFCGNARGFQLHVIDVYDNEVIFMNRPCGSTYMFCCYPVMEVYSPPMVPIGAVTKPSGFCKENYDIVDSDQNVIFKIYGGSTCKFICGLTSLDLTIHALDPQSTVVGLIRREFISYLDHYANIDYYGISFPKDMDVRLKAVFLGAAFLFDFMYFE